ncbi:MAG: PepSY-associated TM helix domain-containing protein [Proteobacteria bacterium]|nr:PepSY-associated TM helix domain-containing protein [Pseudomonadota bacterium]MBU1057766.1 PepSY-associated TM helix domain-containing protein [Pseudomonadota bacterium]
MAWKKWNFILHRDMGYLCIGLTLLYGISGLVVNHTSHAFNPSYTIETQKSQVSPLAAGKSPDMNYIQQCLQELNVTAQFKNVTMLTPETMRIFAEGYTIDVSIASGETVTERVERRPILFAINYLHLNKGKGAWTWIADIYALAICLLALTGFLMIGGTGRRRALVLTIIGFLCPLLYLLLLQ